MKKSLSLLLFISMFFTVYAQVKIGDNPAVISPGSVLELESTNKALTLPRVTSVQMEAIPSPINGMLVFNIDSNCIYLYKTNNVWASINPVAVELHTWPYGSYQPSSGTIAPGNANGIISLTGNGLIATGEYSHAEGLNSVASGIYSWSSGNADTSSGNASIAMGFQNKAFGDYSLAAGYKNIAAYQSSIALGQENLDSGWASMTMGFKNRIANLVSYSNILGYNNRINAGWSNTVLGESNTIKNGKANFVTGINNNSEGNYNNLLGNNNLTVTGNSNLLAGEKNVVNSGNSNIVLGFNNNAVGNFNHLSGKNNGIISGNSNLLTGESNFLNAGNANILIGLNNSAEANYSAAIGNENIVYSQSAIAMGQGNKDSGWASITGGFNNTIEKNIQYSTSFGVNNISTKNDSLKLTIPGAATFSAGSGNINSGYGSIALGGANRSGNLFSLAANHYTMSNGYGMSSFGHFNDTALAYPGQNYLPDEILFTIGNGVNADKRRNSFTMLRNGFTTINTSPNLGINIPRAELDIKGTGAIIVPVGNSAQRPPAPVEGMIRLCTDCGSNGTAVLQGYDGTAWVNL